MNLPMNLVKEVPEIYVDESRDMQLLLRLMNCVYNGVKFDIDSIMNLTRTDLCKSNYLELLQSKLGFFSDKKFDLEDLRFALSAFPWLMKNKGSKKAIEQAVYAYLKMRHLKTDVLVEVYNQENNEAWGGVEDHTVVIAINGSTGDTTILDEILRYIIPTGYQIKYVKYEKPKSNDVVFEYNIASIITDVPDKGDNQVVREFNSASTSVDPLRQSAGTQNLYQQEAQKNGY